MEFFRNTVNRLLKPLDLALLPRDVQWERDVLLALYESSRTWRRKDFQFPVECIVFSKDRALQLHALLSSYFEKSMFLHGFIFYIRLQPLPTNKLTKR